MIKFIVVTLVVIGAQFLLWNYFPSTATTAVIVSGIVITWARIISSVVGLGTLMVLK